MKTCVLVPVAILVASCSSLSQPEQARGIALDELPANPDRWQTDDISSGSVEIGWVEALGDPVLEGLVVEAIENNRDLRTAAAAVDEARALARQAGAAVLPSLDVTGSAGESGIIDGPSSESYALGLQLGWEADVWGRVRATKRSAALGATAAEADYLFTQYSIAAAVTQAYLLAIEAGLQLDVAKRSLEALQQTSDIVSIQRDVGVASGLDLALSRRDLANARDAVLEAEGGERLALRALQVLLGRYPDARAEIVSTLPSVPAPPPPGTPSTLLERRPDIIAAELNVASRFNNVQAAKAARLPVFSIVGATSGSSPELSSIFETGNVGWQAAANLLGPLFDGGLRQARVDEATAEQKQALNSYAQAAIEAFQEVEDSLDQNAVLRARRSVLAQAAQEASRAFEIAQIQYEEGETNLLDVLTIQSTAFAAESALVSVERSLLVEWINLNLALGGSWETQARN